MRPGHIRREPLESRLIRDRYWILAELGRGGMGITYRAWDGLHRTPVVIKTPLPSLQGNEVVLRRFVQELHAMLALKHEHIVPIVDYGDDGHVPFVAMRYLAGGSLADYRQQEAAGGGRVNPPSMLHCWLPGIAAALDFIHGHGVLHRDVKPANVFFDSSLRAFLGDFGIAKAADESARMLRNADLTADNSAIGTPLYMAPEQFARGTSATPRADQYALAVTVYEMLAGKPPFTGEKQNIAVEHATASIPVIDTAALGISARARTAIEKGLAKNPHDRHDTCTAFAQAVLADVPPLLLETDIFRFLCPKCGIIIRLDRSRAGSRGRCLRCRAVIEVAADLSALWLLAENHGYATEDSTAATGAGGTWLAETWPRVIAAITPAWHGTGGWHPSRTTAMLLTAAATFVATWSFTAIQRTRERMAAASALEDSRAEAEDLRRQLHALQRAFDDAR